MHKKMTLPFRLRLCSAALLGLVMMVGCGQDDGLKRYRLSGKVSMADGKPVPAGELNLEPDGTAGNTGPGSMTQIKNGTYSLPTEQGVIGGSYLVTILPFDGVAFGESEQGKPLTRMPYVEKIEFPAKDSTHDFVVSP